MKKSKAGQRYIKRVEVIPEEEFKTIGVFQSMIERFSEHTPLKGRDTYTRMVLDVDGELKEIEIDEIVGTEDMFKDAFSDGRTLLGVRLHWSDGEVEYGFKMWRMKDRVYDKNKVLVPLFVKVGVVNEETGKIEDVFGSEREVRAPAWILKLLPRWNERIRDAVNSHDPSIEDSYTSLDDWGHVAGTVSSNYVSSGAVWKEVNTGKTKRKMAVSFEFDKNKWWNPVMTTWKKNICKEEFGSIAEMLEMDAAKVFCYDYLKSIYSNRTKYVKEFKVIPMSSVLQLKRRKWDGDIRDYVETEIWNQLDETCRGNV